jgi:hypothetical protein
MRRFAHRLGVAALVGVWTLTASAAAQAGTARYTFENLGGKPIIVAMDNDREVHTIPAHARVTFQGANLGQRPTFVVYAVQANGARGRRLGSDSFSTLRLFHLPGGRALKWTGSKITD